MAFPRVQDVEALVAHCSEHALQRLNRLACEAQIEPHLVAVAAVPAEIGLHINDDQRRVLRPQVAVVGPWSRLGRNLSLGHNSHRQ